MITIFNRRELTVTNSMEKQAQLREKLAAGGIDYKIKTVNRRSASPFGSGSRSRTGSYGENQALAYEYIFYVNKEDLAKAQGAIR